MKLHKIFLIATISSFAASAIIGIIALISFDYNESLIQGLFSALTLSFFCLTNLAAAYAIHFQRFQKLAYFGIATSVTGVLSTVLMIWVESLIGSIEYGSFTFVFIQGTSGLSFLLAGESAVACLLLIPTKTSTLSKRARALALIGLTLIAVIFLDVVFTVTGFSDDYVTQEYYGRITGGLALLTAASALAFPLLLHFEKIRREEETTTTDLTLRIFCPRCALDQQITAGHGQCANCKLKINLSIEEPRCTKCNYVLYQMASDKCPECGQLIAPENRWACTLEPSPADSTNQPHETQ